MGHSCPSLFHFNTLFNLEVEDPSFIRIFTNVTIGTSHFFKKQTKRLLGNLICYVRSCVQDTQFNAHFSFSI